MVTTDNAIEIPYRALNDCLSLEYEALYNTVQHAKLKTVFSTLHAKIIYLFDRMNLRLPTSEDEGYFWANESRELIKCIDLINQLQKSLMNTPWSFYLATYYADLLNKCSVFLCQNGGSTIPPHMDKIELYYKIPIFKVNNISVGVDMPEIRTISREYIAEIAKRAKEDIENENYDSAITKCRTLLEETFCYIIELKQENPTDSGNINRLYNQVKQLYNMHQDQNVDNRINMLLSGLEKILTSISKMRNENSDSHGVGQRRIRIAEHHARLFVNAAITMAEFILSVGETQH